MFGSLMMFALGLEREPAELGERVGDRPLAQAFGELRQDTAGQRDVA